MEEVMGVLLYHSTHYGKADFNVYGCTKTLFQEVKNCNKEQILNAYMHEARQQIDEQDASFEEYLTEIKDLFDELYNEMKGE